MLDYIEHIVYINLASRPDRRSQIEGTLSCFPPEKIYRLDAVYESDGCIGCLKSHIEAIKLAQQMKWSHVLILEDDSVWNTQKGGIDVFTKLVQQDFDVILLSGTHVDYEPTSFRLNSAQTSNAYLLAEHYYSTLLECFEYSLTELLRTGHVYRFALDIAWKRLQAVDNWFIVMPCLMIQAPGYSDILKSEQDYTHLYI